MVDGRKVAIGFGIVAVLVALGFGGYRVYDWFVDATGKMKAVGEPALTTLADRDWDATQLLPFATKFLNDEVRKADSKALFEPVRYLGKVKQFLGVRKVNQYYRNGQWGSEFEEQVSFEGGPASAFFYLGWVDGGWRLNGLRILPIEQKAP